MIRAIVAVFRLLRGHEPEELLVLLMDATSGAAILTMWAGGHGCILYGMVVQDVPGWLLGALFVAAGSGGLYAWATHWRPGRRAAALFSSAIWSGVALIGFNGGGLALAPALGMAPVVVGALTYLRLGLR